MAPETGVMDIIISVESDTLSHLWEGLDSSDLENYD
jgi:hypothetical protein